MDADSSTPIVTQGEEQKQVEYKDIDRVNSEINMIDLKGKDYAMVPERVIAFRKLFPDGFITTDIVHLSDDGTVVLMKAQAGLGTG